MSIEMVDMTGQPIRDSDLDEAIETVKFIMVKKATVLPEFTVMAVTILHALQELQTVRRIIRESRKKKEAEHEAR